MHTSPHTHESRLAEGGSGTNATSVYPNAGAATRGAAARLTLTVPEVSARLGVPAKTVYWWCEQGVLPHLKIQRRVLVPVAALEQWLAAQTQPGAQPVPAPDPSPLSFPVPRSRHRKQL